MTGNDNKSKSGSFITTTNNSRYDVSYSITGGTINEITPICDSASIIVLFDSDKTGNLTLSIPRNLLDTKFNGIDDEFFVILDGAEISYEETSNKHSRDITISFEPGSYDLEIIASWNMSLESETISCNAVHDPPYSYILRL